MSPFRACLRALGEEVGDDLPGGGQVSEGPYKSPLLYFDFVEFCGGSGGLSRAAADLGLSVAPVLDLSESGHYDLGSLRLLEWAIHMLAENRFRSCAVEPPCTTFSPAAWPAVRSYLAPLGFDRLNWKTWKGNQLCFRGFVIMMVAKRYNRPSLLEQPRRSKMAWTQIWRYMLEQGLEEAIVASCQFGSPHQKEFRLLCYLLDVIALEVRCPGGHQHIVIQGKYTKASAAYVPGLALHIAREFRRALERIARLEVDYHPQGSESVVGNDVLSSSRWSLRAFCPWRSPGHINVLETRMGLKVLTIQARQEPDSRFSGFLDSQVAKGALSKGRSSSRALQPLCKKAAAVQVVACLYPSWNFSPTRLNVADDPTRDVSIRSPVAYSIFGRDDVDFTMLHQCQLRRPFANWIRLLLLVTLLAPSEATHLRCKIPTATYIPSLDFPVALLAPSEATHSRCKIPTATYIPSLDFTLQLPSSFDLGHLRVSSWTPPWIWFWISPCGCHWILATWLFPFMVGCLKLGGLVLVASLMTVVLVQGLRKYQTLLVLACVASELSVVHAMEPMSAAERKRAEMRSSTSLVASRTVKAETRQGRQKLLEKFSLWLSEFHGIKLFELLSQKPADPERDLQVVGAVWSRHVLIGKVIRCFSRDDKFCGCLPSDDQETVITGMGFGFRMACR